LGAHGGDAHRGRRSDRIWQPGGIWSLDGSKIAVSDWQFTDDPTMNIVELAVNDTTTRIVTTIPRSSENPEAYLRDGRIVFTAQGTTSGIVKVSVAKLLGLP
jgi:Tol biopolymer transport system component